MACELSLISLMIFHALQDRLTRLADLRCHVGMESLKSMAVACLNWDASCRPQPTDVANQISITQSPKLHSGNAHEAAPSLRQHDAKPEGKTGSVPPPGVAVPAAPSERSAPATNASSEGNHPAAGNKRLADEEVEKSPRECMLPAASPKMCAFTNCDKKTIKPYGVQYCWIHIDHSFPDEIKLTQALAANGVLQELVPCDLIAAILHTKPDTPLAVAAIVYFLKVPAAIEQFMQALAPCNGRADAPALLAALLAASEPERQSSKFTFHTFSCLVCSSK